MDNTAQELLNFVKENDVKFIRLMFCDIFGEIKNISVMAEHLTSNLESGVTFDASAIRGFMNISEADLLLKPDFGTLSLLPWRPHQGSVMRMFCDITYPDGSNFEGDCRRILKSVMRRAERQGYNCRVGNECEFYLFETDNFGKPTMTPQDNAGYMDFAPDDKGENIRRDICLMLEQMGIKPETSCHKKGPGQNEIDFRFNYPVNAADDFTMFKAAVKTVAGQNGLYATFMPKPLENESGNGVHMNLSLTKNGKNIFEVENGRHNLEAESFIEGILRHIREITVFTNPTTNSYKRLGKNEAPEYVTWSHQNRSQLVRIPSASGEKARMELRSPDAAGNPYIVLALLISAGLEGIENKYKLRDAFNHDCYTVSREQLDGIEKLPESLAEAIEIAKESEFVKKVLPEKIIKTYLSEKKKIVKEYEIAKNKKIFEHLMFF